MKFKLFSLLVVLLAVFGISLAGCGTMIGNNNGSNSDTTAPTVSSTTPPNAATGVAINRKISATFSEKMDLATISTTTFILKQGTTAVAGTVNYSGIIATFTPASNLAINTTYEATILTGAKDLAGNALAVAKTWRFTTGASADSTAPTVSSTSPADLDTGVALNSNVTATFSEGMDPATITATTFTLMQGTTAVAGAVTYAGSVATFTPASNLSASTTYTATITTGVNDLAGNALAANKTWSFTTGTTTAAGPAPVNLGTADEFVILSKAGISTTGTTQIFGNIGVSPIDRTALTGFAETMDPSNVFSTSIYVSAPGAFVASSGKLYAADYTEPTPSNMTTAISNMETAYTDAAGRANPTATELGAGNIGGMTLAPGLYKWSTGLLIPTDVTLAGGANDVWIFEVAQDLTLASGIKVKLSGGAQAKNVFWQVAGQTTLVTGSTMNGNMICQTLIAMQTGSTLNGRLLAQTAVTLDSATVTLP